MTRSVLSLAALLLVAVTAFAIGSATQSVTAAQSASVSEVATEGACPPPQSITVWIDDALYTVNLWQPSTTPTRFPTVTPLVNGTNTAGPAPTRTATATPAACKTYVVTAVTLNVRAGAGTNFAILKTLNKGDTVSLSTLAADRIVVNGVTWIRICGQSDPSAFVSGAWVEVAK